MLAAYPPEVMTDDDGQAIGFKVLKRGTPVRSSDGVELGKVRRVDENMREHIFDGIVMDTPQGLRFLDAPEVARIAELAVTTTFPAAELEQHLQPVGSRVAAKAKNTTTARRMKRLRERAKERWDRR
jgi:hypothetical protein